MSLKPSGKGKETIKSRLRTFFGKPKEAQIGSNRGDLPGAKGHFVTEKLLREVSCDSDWPIRQKTLNRLEQICSSHFLEDWAIESIWACMRDLCGVEQPAEVRNEALLFVLRLCESQAANLGLNRAIFFDYFSHSSNRASGDLAFTIALLKCLSTEGKDVGEIGEIAPFLLELNSEALKAGGVVLVDFCALMRNFIKFNSAQFDEEFVSAVVNQICIFACGTRAKPTEVQVCLNLIETCQCYSYLPPPSLLVVVSTLCKLVNVQQVCEVCWKLMKNLLNSHSGHRGVYVMCNILESFAMYHSDASPLRGAVFFLGMSLWGSQKVSVLKHSPTAILSAMCVAIDSDSPMVAYEVGLSVHRLVIKYGVDLQLVTWDLITEVIAKLIDFLHRHKLWAGSNCPLPESLNDTLTVMERYYEANSFNGSSERLFALVESCFHHRPEGSILRLLAYKSLNINPFQPGWIDSLKNVLATFYKQDARPSVRIKATNLLRNIYTETKFLYAEELVETVIVPLFQTDLELEIDREVQATSVNLLVDVAKETESESFFAITSILGGIVNTKLENGRIVEVGPEELADYWLNVDAVVCGLVEILQSKWNRSSADQSLFVFDLLVRHLNLEYSGYDQMEPSLGGQVREAIFALILHLRASWNGRVGLASAKGVDYSAFITAVLSGADDTAVAPGTVGEDTAPDSIKILPLKFVGSLEAISSCLQKERHWPVLKSVLLGLPLLLHQRLLILQTEEPIKRLCASALQMLGDASRAVQMVGTPDKLDSSELAELSYPLLAVLISFSQNFSTSMQEKLMMGIQRGLVSHNSTTCVLASINGVLDLPGVMGPMMRDLIGRLAEIKPAPKFAIPLLELLSTIMRLENLYDNFEEADFVQVFDLVLPYTNSYKFTHFIVSMGYHITFRWFLKCPIAVRFAAAKKIIKCLSEPLSDSRDVSMDRLHQEGKAVCLQFLSHFLFTDRPASGKNAVGPPLLFSTKNCHSWVIDERLVTISLSGSDSPSGLCAKCTTLLTSTLEAKRLRTRFVSGATIDSMDSSIVGNHQLPTDIRKRHRSELQTRVTRKPVAPVTSLDDSCLTSLSETQPTIEPRPFPLPHESDDFCQSWDEESLLKLASCGCWCRGWAKVQIRHAFGDSIWFVSLNGFSPNPKIPVDSLNAAKIIGDILTAFIPQSPPKFQLSSTPDKTAEADWEFRQKKLSPGEFASGTNLAAETANLSTSRNSSQPDFETPTGTESNVLGDLQRRTVAGGNLQISTESSANDTPFASPLSTATSTQVPSTVRSSNALSSGSADHPYETELKGSEDMIAPSFVLLQLLCHSSWATEIFDRTMKVLDRISPYETHKIGVIYVGRGQTNEAEILRNQFGSLRYQNFVERLGSPLVLKGVDTSEVFLGGLETDSGRDGAFTYHWSDQITQATFHVATLMPTTSADPNCRQKKLHIGNDFVCIIYNDSQSDFDLGTIKGQFSYVAIVVTPVDESHYLVALKAKDEISRWLALKLVVVSDANVALVCRQMAMRADLSCNIWSGSQRGEPPFLSHAVERIRKLRGIREKLDSRGLTANSAGNFLDFC